MRKKETNKSVGLGRHREVLEQTEYRKIMSGFHGLPRSKREPAVKLSDGSGMVLGRRGIFLGKDTQDMAELLNCRKKL